MADIIDMPDITVAPRRFVAASQAPRLSGCEFRAARVELALGTRRMARLMGVARRRLRQWETHGLVPGPAHSLALLMLWEHRSRA